MSFRPYFTTETTLQLLTTVVFEMFPVMT